MPTKNEPKENKGQFGVEFRRLIEQNLNVTEKFKDRVLYERLLMDGDDLAQFLEPIVKEFLTSFDQRSAPPEMRLHLERIAEALVFYGLRTHCLLFKSEYRHRHNPRMNLEELYERWLVDSMTASWHLRGYDKDNCGIPTLVFNTVFDGEVEPMQRLIGLGWWRRMKNRNKFCNLFESGILLALIYDVKSKELATAKTEQVGVSPPVAPSEKSVPELTDEDIPF
jgi:hypothetical protein